MNSELIVKGLKKQYKNSNKVVLNDFSFDVKEKEFLCILGPSGCGKTTLLRCIAGFESYEGTIIIDGNRVEKPGNDRVVVFQNFEQLFPWKTVLGNITYVLKIKGVKDRTARVHKAEEILQKVGLYDSRSLYPYQLSGGMKQRVAIARALVLEPKFILMDEPFASVDAMTRRKLQNELISKFEAENISIIFITHNVQEALILGTRIMVLSQEGNIVVDMKNDLEKPVTPETEGYGEYWSSLLFALENGRMKETDYDD
ncbi:MAG: ABC transporter ATP-binding protein [Lachnospiraceae bacterium]|nr:ABC transporter ATP-binding protein [Lachnospiraceae bacterium]